MLLGTIDFYHFIWYSVILALAEVSRKQGIIGSIFHTLFNGSGKDSGTDEAVRAEHAHAILYWDLCNQGK